MPETPPIEQLWELYKSSGSREARDQLIVHYAPLVKFVAGRVGTGLPQNVEQADLVSYGIFGLMDAIDRFELERKLKFETYAVARIKGAIIDELRSIDWVPRSVRAKARAYEQAYAGLEATLGRTPTDAEVAERLGVSDDELHALFTQLSLTGVVPLDELLGGDPSTGEGARTVSDGVPDATIEGPVQAFEINETREILAGAVGRLGDREKLVLTLYYYESLTLAEIGEVLGVTESRVCQIHTKALLQLRTKLADTEREPA